MNDSVLRVGLRCVLVSALAIVATACGQNGLGDATGATCPTGSTLTYENFGKAFFDHNCNDCHASKESPHFTSQAVIQANRSDIDRAAASGPNATNTYMPDDGDLSDAERKKLGEWLACGAP
jgi:hypothetical protein